jgi:ketosteroid isomerase-like protein
MERALREKSDTGNVSVSTKEPLMSRTEPANMRAILEIFSAIERRDLQRLLELCHADVRVSLAALPALRWDITRAQDGAAELGPHVDPAAAHRRRADDGPTDRRGQQRRRGRPLAAAGHQSGRDRLDSPVLGLYEIRDGKLARARMFYFDPTAVADFLATAESRAA